MRNTKGQYAKESNSMFSLVVGVVLLAILVLVLNHTQSKRLDAYNNHMCHDVYGLDNSCNAIN